MLRYLFPILFVLLAFRQPAHAQDAAHREDLRFLEALRSRGDNRLALEFLERLRRSAPPDLVKELSLEFAKTSLRAASDEPEASKRLALYKKAREEFLAFIASNPGHRRIPEANVDIARVLNLQGKTELNRALLTEDLGDKQKMAQQARNTLVTAATQLATAEKELQLQLAKIPDPESLTDPKEKKEALGARARLDDELRQTQIERGLNLYDQSATFLGGMDAAASDLLVKAKGILDPLVSGDLKHASTWKARAWVGRIVFETDTADKARARFQEVLNASGNPAAFDGVRLARYFRLQVIRKQPSDAEKKPGIANNVIIEAANRWRQDYPRYLTTPEGTGLTFLLAEVLLEDAQTRKTLTPQQRSKMREYAQTLLRELENSENEFTDRARRLKIQAMALDGLFKKPIASLVKFDQLYVRAQFEASQMAQDLKDTKDPAEAEKKRKARIETIIQTLERALALPEVGKMKASMELNTARSMLAYWALQTGKLAEAIRAGETFARQDPQSSQAEMAAVYALQAYSQLIAQKQAKFEDLAEDRAKMFALASYMERYWDRGLGGELARHSVGLQLLREENFPEAIKKLAMIAPSYGSYPLVCFQLADACTRAEKGSVEPISGDRAGDYRKRAMLALESMPESALGADPFMNQIYVSGKAMLGRDMFRLKRFQQMDDLATGLLEKVGKLKFNDDEDKDRATRAQLRFELSDIKLYARYGLADAAFQANDFAKVVALLDPMVDAVVKNSDSQEKVNLQKNQQLGSALLILALRSNVQLGKIDRTDVVLDVLDQVSGEGGDSKNVLRLLAFLIRGQIEEMRKKEDKAGLTRAIKGYGTILDKRIAKEKNLTTDFLRVVADCYSSMEEHGKSAAELGKIKDPKAKPGTDEEKVYRQVQVALIRELRLSKTKANLVKARGMMNEIMGSPPKNPGWGARDLLALKEQGKLLEAEEKPGEAFTLWSGLTKRLAPQAPKGGPAKDHYLECYFHMITCHVKIGATKASKDDRDKFMKTAALQIAQFERSWEEFGSEASKKRFNELLASEAALKEQYEAIKKKK